MRLSRMAVGTALVLLVLWNGCLVHAMATTLQMGDFKTMYLSAAAYLTGHDMYQLPSATLFIGTKQIVRPLVNLNPPHLHLLLLPLAWMPAPLALTVWGLASLASLIFCLVLILRETDVALNGRVFVRGSVALLALSATGAVCGTGQVSLLLLLPVTLAWVAARNGRWTRAGAYLGLAMSLKLFLLIFLPYLLLRRRVGATAAACAVCAGSFVLGVSVFGIDNHHAWLQGLVSVDWPWRSMNASVLGILSRSFTDSISYAPLVRWPALVTPLWWLAVVFVALLTIIGALRDASRADTDRAFALLILASLLISPLGWIYYLWFALGPIVALVRTWRMSLTDPHDFSASEAARWRMRLLYASIPGLVAPYFATLAFQPSPWSTIVLGSAYFWATFALWSALIVDGLFVAGAPGPALSPS